MWPNQGHVCAGMWCSGNCAWHSTAGRVEASSRANRSVLLICSSHTPALLCPLLMSVCKRRLQLLSWVTLHVKAEVISGCDSTFWEVFRSLGFRPHFPVHTLPDRQQLCYDTWRAAVLIGVLLSESGIATDFIWATTSLNQTATRTISTFFMPALVSSPIPLDPCCLTFTRVS